MGGDCVRGWFRRWLAVDDDSSACDEQPAQVGRLELADFQRRAAERGLQIVRAFGGVILADAVGLGKTRVSLAIARSLVRDARLRGARAAAVWVCVPARLERQWREALARAEVATFEVLTHTQLSRGQICLGDTDDAPAVVVVDEAHRFRNPNAKRSQALARLSARAPVVLATATPVCNSRWDLYHLLSLFLAEHDLRGAVGHNLREAFELVDRDQVEPEQVEPDQVEPDQVEPDQVEPDQVEPDQVEQADFDLTDLVEQVVIRRTAPPSQAGFGRRPNVSLEVLRYEAHGEERWLWQNLEAQLAQMEMALFRADWPRQLLVQYVLKRWESGADALLATLTKMCDFHRRWLEADRHGRTLSRKRYRELFDGDVERRQGVFPFLFDGKDGAPACPKDLVKRDLSMLDGLRERALQVAGDKDAKRHAISELISRDGQKMLVFTSYQHAAHGLYEHLVDALGAQAKVGLVTGDGAWATGLGKTDSQEVIRRFAPLSNGLVRLNPHQRLDVLVSTDCLSEGVNLQDCGRVVLSDLPYSPLGVEQRIGRLVRPGGPHERVTVYLPRPLAWADSLGMRRRLDRKLADAAGSGAAFVTAGGLASGSARPVPDRDPESWGALGALTRLDALVASMQSQESTALSEGFFRAEARRGPPRLWARVVVEEEESRRWLWCLVTEGKPPEMRLSRLVGHLAREVDVTAPIRRDAPSKRLLDAAQHAIRRREKLLRAARLAPFPLRLDAPQRRVWAELREHVASGALSVDADEMSRLRHNLLRSFPRGTERRLEELVEAGLPAGRLAGQLRQVVGDVPRWSPQVRLRIVAALQIS